MAATHGSPARVNSSEEGPTPRAATTRHGARLTRSRGTRNCSSALVHFEVSSSVVALRETDMKRLSIAARLAFALCLVTLTASMAPARAADSRGIVFFGDSLSDPGNHYIAFGQVTRPPYQPVAIYPYAMGG